MTKSDCAKDLDVLSHRELQSLCRADSLPSGGKTAQLRKRLLGKKQRREENIKRLRQKLNEKKKQRASGEEESGDNDNQQRGEKESSCVPSTDIIKRV